MPVGAPRSGRALQPAGNCPPATARSGSPFPPSWANATNVVASMNVNAKVPSLCELIITEILHSEYNRPACTRYSFGPTLNADMNRTKSTVALALGVSAFALWNLTPARAQQGAPASGEWRVNGGDTGSTRYSPLDQISAANVKNLQVVWRWKAQNMGPAPQSAWEVTPLMVGGKLFFTAGTGRTVVAADAATGETLWTYRGDDTAERGAVRANNRGLRYWSDGRGDDRILFITPGYQLVALNAKSGAPISTFGKDSHVDLWLGLDRQVVQNGTIGATSPPIIIRDVAVVGAALKVGVSL